MSYARQYVQTLQMYEEFEALGRDVLLITFENLQNDIWRVLEFLFTKEYLSQNKAEFQRRNCIFEKNEKPLPRSAQIRRPKVQNSSLHMTKDQFFERIDNKAICRIWGIMKEYVIKYDLQRWGYFDLMQ